VGSGKGCPILRDCAFQPEGWETTTARIETRSFRFEPNNPTTTMLSISFHAGSTGPEDKSSRDLGGSESVQTVAALKCLNERAEAAFGARR
jgi:hypothetical protein